MKKTASRLQHFGEGIFAKLERKVRLLQENNRPVYNLSVGTPDFLPPDYITETLCKYASDPQNYKYTLCDYPFMLKEVENYYKSRYGVPLNAENEIISVHGTQEGMGHLGLSLCDRGDVVLLPNPGYPVFEVGARFGDAEIYYYPLLSENKFLPKLSEIPKKFYKKARYFVTSYPSNPTGAVAPRAFYEELIEYAEKYDFWIINDNAYSDIVFVENSGFSFLSLPGAKENGAEFFSLSKTFNVTGMRVSFLVGNAEIVGAVNKMRSQLDFGMFLPIQHAAVAALKGDHGFILEQCNEYRRRRDALCGGLRSLGWDVSDSDGTMFVFAKIPEGFASSVEFCETLIDKCGIVCTPGTAFGSLGEGYVRFALIKPVSELKMIVDIIKDSKILG